MTITCSWWLRMYKKQFKPILFLNIQYKTYQSQDWWHIIVDTNLKNILNCSVFSDIDERLIDSMKHTLKKPNKKNKNKQNKTWKKFTFHIYWTVFSNLVFCNFDWCFTDFCTCQVTTFHSCQSNILAHIQSAKALNYFNKLLTLFSGNTFNNQTQLSYICSFVLKMMRNANCVPESINKIVNIIIYSYWGNNEFHTICFPTYYKKKIKNVLLCVLPNKVHAA